MLFLRDIKFNFFFNFSINNDHLYLLCYRKRSLSSRTIKLSYSGTLRSVKRKNL